MTIILPASLATAAACALINLWLSIRIGQVRQAHQVWIGDGGNPAVIARMRAQANFIESAPIVLVLLLLLELATGTSVYIWAYGVLFVIARVFHGVGMDTWKPGRMIGALVTMIISLLLAIHCAWVAISTPDVSPRTSVTLPASA